MLLRIGGPDLRQARFPSKLYSVSVLTPPTAASPFLIRFYSVFALTLPKNENVAKYVFGCPRNDNNSKIVKNRYWTGMEQFHIGSCSVTATLVWRYFYRTVISKVMANQNFFPCSYCECKIRIYGLKNGGFYLKSQIYTSFPHRCRVLGKFLRIHSFSPKIEIKIKNSLWI